MLLFHFPRDTCIKYNSLSHHLDERPPSSTNFTLTKDPICKEFRITLGDHYRVGLFLTACLQKKELVVMCLDLRFLGSILLCDCYLYNHMCIQEKL